MEFRKDPIVGRWVAFAPERAARPFDHGPPREMKSLARCPFCIGNEDLTPEAVLQQGLSGERSSEWLVRVIPNYFPAFASSGVEALSPSRQASSHDLRELRFESAPADGRHEVLIESPNHCRSMSELTGSQFVRIVEMYRQRISSLREEDRLAHVLIFKNQGRDAGASLEHVHSQLVGMPFVPHSVEIELEAAARFAGHSPTAQRTLWSEILNQERRDVTRVVYESDSFCVFCPYASRFPFESWVVPKRPEPDFTASTRGEIHEFSELLHRSLTAIEKSLPLPAYNFALCTAPFRDPRSAAYHWHLKITPRIAGIAGFEIGTGDWINIVMPEDAASRLRDAW